jgi:tellurite resistance protein TehA-like permease
MTDETTRGNENSQNSVDNPVQVPLEPPSTLVKRAIATLDPGYFAMVMGSGIVSVAASLVGLTFISTIVLMVTIVAFVILLLAYISRIIWFRQYFIQSLREPNIAMGYFTLVAGSNVLGVRMLMAGQRLITLILAIFAGIIWLILTYGLPSFIVSGARRPIFREINGTWLIWVVATQSVAISASGLALAEKNEILAKVLPIIAVFCWGVGVMLYLILIVMIFFRLLLVEVTPKEMGPAYWIAMGATAISARAAAGILVLKGAFATVIVSDLRPFLIGLSVVLWAFGTWWIPLLILFGIWRYIVKRYSSSYEPRLWSVVFPLGMYAVASFTLGKATKLDFMVSISRVWFWVGATAWLLVLILMGYAAWKLFTKERRKAPSFRAGMDRR